MHRSLVPVILALAAAPAAAQASGNLQLNGSDPRSFSRLADLQIPAPGAVDIAIANFASDDVIVVPATSSQVSVPLTPNDHGPVAVHAGRIGASDVPAIAVACQTSSTVAVVTMPNTAGAVAGSTSLLPLGTMSPRAVLFADHSDEVFIGTEGDPFHPGKLLHGIRAVDNTLTGLAEFVPIPTGIADRIVALLLRDCDDDPSDLEVLALAQGAGGDAVLLFDRDGNGVPFFAGALPLASTGTAQAFDVAQLNPAVDAVEDLLVLQPAIFPTPVNSMRAFVQNAGQPFGPARFTAAADIGLPGTFGIRFSSRTKIDPTVAGADVLLVNGGSHEVLELFDLDLATGQFGHTAPVPGESATNGPIDIATILLEPRARLANRTVDYYVLNNTVNQLRSQLNVANAVASIGGTGCVGTNNLVPRIGISGSLSVGSAMAVTLADGLGSALDVLAFSFPPSTNPSFLGTPLGTSGCSLIPPDPIITTIRVTTPTGTDSFPVVFPATLPGGIPVMFQWAVLDPNGAFANLASMSNGLLIVTGL
ncbi:MAG: hypothetical protein U1E73_04745 [Planctomycetota bacterium]